jgi:predicted phosphodiesterase
MPKGAPGASRACVQRLKRADAILHAGDLVRIEVLRALEAFGPPVHAVHGNDVDDGGCGPCPLHHPSGRARRRADGRDDP